MPTPTGPAITVSHAHCLIRGHSGPRSSVSQLDSAGFVQLKRPRPKNGTLTADRLTLLLPMLTNGSQMEQAN
ncbi:hypothetical protein ColTof3_08106 [Colletotrichum tofieldiae]|nr:hypothetical protein ColTof3_08106 [Colletotrichum tofieldiae]GKT90516.1 hypothetical protein Ct61P_08366 [Colletotrichum tofieldiae]